MKFILISVVHHVWLFFSQRKYITELQSGGKRPRGLLTQLARDYACPAIQLLVELGTHRQRSLRAHKAQLGVRFASKLRQELQCCTQPWEYL